MKHTKSYLLITLLLFLSCSSETNTPLINSFDESGIPPSGFRVSHTIVLPDEDLNLTGLERLNASGSSQFSKMGLKTLVKKIGHNKITIVNLREEDIGFVEPEIGSGGYAFSYLSNHSHHRSVEEIESSEEQRMQEILRKKSFTLYGTENTLAPKDQLAILEKIDIVVKRTLTERELVAEEKLRYFRIPNKKFASIRPEEVDRFVSFVKSFPQSEWLHFHDEKGGYRTTLFMTMYDIMRNAKDVTAEEIIKRQGPKGVGGIELDDENKEFLKQFHRYVLTGLGTTWSQWAKAEKIPTHSVQVVKPALSFPKFPSDEHVYDERTLILNTISNSSHRAHNFRTTQDTWLRDDPKFNPAGLRDYKASGSSQYVENNLPVLAQNLKDHADHVVIVDLRPDDHIFVNGVDVCSFETKDVLLALKSNEEIEKTRKDLKDLISSQEWIQLSLIDTKYPRNNYDVRLTMTVKPELVQTAKELVESVGLDYECIAHNRFSDIEDVNIDKIVNLAKKRSKNTWYHFHCKKGKSRTTLYMVIFDILHNADKASLEDIIYRQKFIGGSDILDITPRVSSWVDEKESKKKWIVFLARFHRYCLENMHSDFVKPWSEWSKENADYSPNIDHLVFDKNDLKLN